jgi:hypothetical protein
MKKLLQICNSFFILGRPSISHLTVLYDHEYMAAIREKLRIIADLQKA